VLGPDLAGVLVREDVAVVFDTVAYLCTSAMVGPFLHSEGLLLPVNKARLAGDGADVSHEPLEHEDADRLLGVRRVSHPGLGQHESVVAEGAPGNCDKKKREKTKESVASPWPLRRKLKLVVEPGLGRAAARDAAGPTAASGAQWPQSLPPPPRLPVPPGAQSCGACTRQQSGISFCLPGQPGPPSTECGLECTAFHRTLDSEETDALN
jgi:hypothetical protein